MCFSLNLKRQGSGFQSPKVWRQIVDVLEVAQLLIQLDKSNEQVNPGHGNNLVNAEYRRLDFPRRVVVGIRRSIRRVRIESLFRTRLNGSSSFVAEASGPSSQKLEVVVVGGGIAGLAAAHNLILSGHKVTVLEAGAQVGGRASSVRRPFSEGLCVDAGGFRFPADHFRVRESLRELGLSSVPFYNESGDMLAYIDGRLIRRKFGERLRPDWLSRPLTEEESWMFDQENETDMFRVDGGVDCFAKALGARISEHVILHAEVRRITQTESGVLVEYVSDGAIKTQFADTVVCAIPYSVLKDVTLVPDLSYEKTEIISGLEYRPGVLVYFEVPTEYWQTLGLSGFGVTDTVGELWSPGMDFSKDTAITVSYTKDDAAEELIGMSQEERIATIAKRMEDFLPDFREFVIRSVSLCWDEDRHIRGSRSVAKFLSPENMELVRRPEGRIHFAGEHTASMRLGWMEGALESAERVTSEINVSCVAGSAGE